jgi:hypothetical protein
MNSIKQWAPKVSDALQAMIDGLKSQSKRKTFKIQMITFGDYDPEDKICFGCAATCTIQQLAHKTFRDRAVESLPGRAGFLDLDKKELAAFESAIDYARKGAFYRLFEFYGHNTGEVPGYLLEPDDKDYYLMTDDWGKVLPNQQAHQQKIKDAGY